MIKNSELTIHIHLHLFIDRLHLLHSHNYICWNSCPLYVSHHLTFLQLYHQDVLNAWTSVVMLHDKAGKQREQFTQILSCKISEQMYHSMFLCEAFAILKKMIQYYLCMGLSYIAYWSVTFETFLNLLEYTNNHSTISGV